MLNIFFFNVNKLLNKKEKIDSSYLFIFCMYTKIKIKYYMKSIIVHFKKITINK